MSFLKRVSILTFIILFVFFGCGKKNKNSLSKATNSKQWYRYISAHTTGSVSKKSQIRVLFVNPVSNQNSISLKNVFDFTPEIKGETKWKSNRELIFIPKNNLSPNTRYVAVLHLTNILDIPVNMQKYVFDFHVSKTEFEVSVEGLSAVETSNPTMQELKGKLTCLDIEDIKDVENILKASQNNKSLSISWLHDNDKKRHYFTIKNIIRAKKQSSVVLHWDGKSIGSKTMGERVFNVPAIDEFKVLKVSAIQTGKQCALIRFSDPLKKNQNLSGLIRIVGQRLRFTVSENLVKVYSSDRLWGRVNIFIAKGIKNTLNKKLSRSRSYMITFQTISPAVRFVGKGNILPKNKHLAVPFEAVNLHSVQVTAFQVYSSNIGQFLQSNNYEGKNQLERVGRYIWRKTIKLSDDSAITGKWSRYNLDLTDLFDKNPGSLFRLVISFNRGNSTYRCDNNKKTPAKETPYKNSEDFDKKDSSSWDYAENYYNSERNNWSHRNDPCYDAYYNPEYNANKVRAERNFIASNTGIIAKMGSKNIINVVTTNIRTSEIISSATINVFNFQGQLIGQGTSDNSGMASIKLSGIPFYLKVKNGKDTGYLKVNSELALPISHFDVSGQVIKKGLKGFIYGERGVWRPGDYIYLTFVIEDNNTLPANHPITMQLFNPDGQLIKTLKPTKSLKPFYAFKIKTDDKAKTGNWKASVLVGGLKFDKSLKIETVVPNHLKVLLSFGDKESESKVLYKDKMPIKANLFSQWLHGADASNLKASVKVRFRKKKTKFDSFQDYVFDDPARVFSGSEQNLFEGKLNSKGRTSFNMKLDVENDCPGMLSAIFESRVFEEGGNFSIDRISVPFHPYSNYVGIKAPKGDIARGMLLTDMEHTINIGTIDNHGKPVSRKKIQVFLYKIVWKWWWDKSGDSLAQYASATHTSIIRKGEISTKNGFGVWKFKIKYPDWGRYMIRAYDPESGHSSGKIVYIDWPGWAGRAREEKGVGATRLTVTSDKPSYNTGETATVFLPETVQGRALISIENGTEVLSQRWIISKKGENKFKIKLTKNMSPNIFVHVSLIQPHEKKINDAPIRMYGIIPIKVNNPDTHLHPTLDCADVFKPRNEVEIKVGEQDGKPMFYTLAIVDEGLLGLTRFKTPDLYNEFYKKEALGVKTWDMFDDVVGAYGAQLERLLALGGDESETEKEREKKKRFPPVVMFKGPFKLDAGKTALHKFTLPQYIGAVRVMLIAGHKKAYGSVYKSVPVKQDLMLLSNLPRITRPDEQIIVPVSVFIMNPDIKEVKVSIETDNQFQVNGDKETIVKFDKIGDKIALFKLKVNPRIGKGKIIIRAKSGQYHAEETTYMNVAVSNPKETRLVKVIIEPGKTWKQKILPFGIKNTQKAILEISGIPPLNLEKRLSYLIRYPHGCLEQTVSSSFPQLYLPSLSLLTKKQKQIIENHINAAIEKLKRFQASNGGFTYWPNTNSRVDNWATNYAVHFLLEAKSLGYYIPSVMYSKMIDYQATSANTWTMGGNRSNLIQAYRLYILAMANQPDLGAMNRLRESGTLNSPVAIQLAAAFNIAGQKGAAKDLISKADLKVSSYREFSGTYGSSLRDTALSLKLLSELGEVELSNKLSKKIETALASKHYLSTQETAFALMAMTEFYRLKPNNDKLKITLSLNGKAPESFILQKPILKKSINDFSYPKGADISITNKNKNKIFVVVYNIGVPKAGEEQDIEEKLSLNVKYYTVDDMFLNVYKLEQGSDFVAEITISNPTDVNYENLALTHLFASGWQVHNPRFDTEDFYNSELDYQDIRDDKILTYFNLNAKSFKKFRVLFNASYQGKFYLPMMSVEAMYDNSVRATKKGKWIDIVKKKK